MVTVEDIAEAWGWKGLQPGRIVAVNAFGHVIVEDTSGFNWRIIPEDWNAQIVASDQNALSELFGIDDFVIDWEMKRVVALAEAGLGPISEERCYCLKVPAILGGKYVLENMGLINRREVIRCAGDCAQQIDGLPDGTTIRLEVVE
ncbi:MAG: DUF1851 domain-containing protein [Pseudomonadota bacterium]